MVVVLTRLTGSDGEHPLEDTFCCTLGLLEQLWVMHNADYMAFNRVCPTPFPAQVALHLRYLKI